jgi:hypothetical protein
MAQRMNMVLQAAQGLEALPGLKIYHGDIKTENALVFPDKQAHVASETLGFRPVVCRYVR